MAVVVVWMGWKSQNGPKNQRSTWKNKGSTGKKQKKQTSEGDAPKKRLKRVKLLFRTSSLVVLIFFLSKDENYIA